MSLTDALWFGYGLFFGCWGLYSYLKIADRLKERKRSKTEFIPRVRPRKVSSFRKSRGARQSKARIIGPK